MRFNVDILLPAKLRVFEESLNMDTGMSWNFRANGHGLALMIVSAFCQLIPQVTLSAAEEVDVPRDGGAAFAITVEDGVLFLNGQDMLPPFQIEAFVDRIYVNGSVYDAVNPADSGQRTAESRQETDASSHEIAGEQRRRGAWGDTENRRKSESGKNRSPGIRQARRLAESLESGEIVVLFDGAPLVMMSTGDYEHAFCSAMVEDPRTEDQVEQVAMLAGTAADADRWRLMARDLRLDPQTAELLQQRVDQIDAVEMENQRQNEAVLRLETFAYPLTLVGMLLGVFAFGHMLQWSGKGITAGAEDGGASEAARCVSVAVLLMFGMSMLDLLWTILAGQAGVMREVNPLAAAYISSPLQLAIFKVVATGLGLGILYAWRQREQIQQAAWWLCLVCVLLTFRWIMLDSMMT